jgi:glycosyltransferase involved in cell wall biosynthesis
MSKRLGIEKNVVFLQNASEKEIIRLYNSLDVFCLPSQYESFGLAAYEAVAAGTPVVLSKTADFEQLASGNGFSVEASDIPAISEKVIAILKDGKLRNGFSAKCYKKIKPFDWTPVVKQTEVLYESLAR